jgi:LexA-binding, inner membrane-associated putative hydrolase
MTAGWSVGGRVSRPAFGLLCAALGMLPDADLLVGMHSRQTHSVGAALIVTALAAVAWPRWRRSVDPDAPSRWLFALACGAAWATHIVLDWLGSDTTPPIGVMALWPFSSAFYQSDLHWFAAITRRYWRPEFVDMNLRAALRELWVLVPILVAVGWLRARIDREN